MSGLLNLTGFSAPTSLGSFLSLLQSAMWRGVPFHVLKAEVTKGRKLAEHNFAFRDGGWMEDMGRALRLYTFTGYLIGDLAPVMQLALDNAAEAPGPGLLIHPSIGAVMVSLVSCATSISSDAGRVISVRFVFKEQGGTLFPTQLIATAVSVVANALSAITSAGASLGATAGPIAAVGGAPLIEGVTTTTAFSAACTTAAADPTALIGMARGLAPVDNNSTWGRYAGGNATVALDPSATVATLQASIAAQRSAVAAAATAAQAAAGTLNTLNGATVTSALFGLTEAVRITMTDPSDQVRVLLLLAGFTFSDAFFASYIGADMAVVRDAMAAACRRAAIASLASASAAYAPTNYQDALSQIGLITAALDNEITEAGDAGDDTSYMALRTLRTSIVTDLTTRAATLASIVTVAFGAALPSLVIGQMLYQDASRSDEIIREGGAPHPAFCPSTFQVLAR